MRFNVAHKTTPGGENEAKLNNGNLTFEAKLQIVHLNQRFVDKKIRRQIILQRIPTWYNKKNLNINKQRVTQGKMQNRRHEE